jgi:type II secretory pathway pseudopilin PulG
MKREAFTIVETLTAIVIIVVLAGLTFAGLAQAKRQAWNSVDVHQLREVGIAAEMYRENAGVKSPLIDHLVDANLLSSTLVVSPLDTTRYGIANHSRQRSGQRMTPYRLTYLSLPEATSVLIPTVEESRGGGMFVSLAGADPAIPGENPPVSYKGRYLRLLFDGSVTSREIVWKSSPSGLRTSWLWLFTDEVDESEKWH